MRVLAVVGVGAPIGLVLRGTGDYGENRQRVRGRGLQSGPAPDLMA